MRKWEELPGFMRVPEVRDYYDYLSGKRTSLILKRAFDITAASLLGVILSPLFVALPVIIRLDSKGDVFFRQTRVTQYGKIFRIHKFRTMVSDAESRGVKLTSKNDSRITRAGSFLRKYHLDEIPQLIDILQGNMTFVGTRPEVPKYTAHYTPEMNAVFLLPAGITSEASIIYQQREAEILSKVAPEERERVYIDEILPEKMKLNLAGIKHFSFWGEIMLMLKTFASVFA